MKPLLKLGIPIGLGILAAVLSYLSSSAAADPIYFVRVSHDVAAGELFTEDNVERLAVPANPGSLKGSAVPFKDRAVLFGRPCPRSLKKGDIVFWRDAASAEPELDLRPGEMAIHIALEGMLTASLPVVVKVGDDIGFYVPSPQATGKPELIGPFRVLTIGRRISREQSERSGSGDLHDITLAVPKVGDGSTLDAKTTRLLAARFGPASGQQQVAIAIWPASRK